MTRPTCECWKWGDTDFSGVGYPGQHMGWITNRDAISKPSYDETWDTNWPFCHWCGKPTERSHK